MGEKINVVDLGGLSHRGKVRPTNEDCFLVAQADRRIQVLLTNVPEVYLPDLSDSTVYAMLVLRYKNTLTYRYL